MTGNTVIRNLQRVSVQNKNGYQNNSFFGAKNHSDLKPSSYEQNIILYPGTRI